FLRAAVKEACIRRAVIRTPRRIGKLLFEKGTPDFLSHSAYYPQLESWTTTLMEDQLGALA
ncbi:MAG TPA: hypothetical protein VGM72_02475, partial [Micropepsaceae bacterium]